jgi:hypothetical protein
MSAAVTTSAAAAAKDRQKTKNVAGPPVYYPPGLELFAKKEDALATQVSSGTDWKQLALSREVQAWK